MPQALVVKTKAPINNVKLHDKNDIMVPFSKQYGYIIDATT